MGKRELVLISVFVVLGILVYRFTAPPPPPGSQGLSISGIFRNIRRGVQGAREVATSDSRQTVPVDADVTALRINIPRQSDITITGQNRTDVAAAQHATARGFDPAEAKATAEATRLKVERVGDAMVVSLDLSKVRTLPPRALPPVQLAITLAVPQRLALRMEPHFGRLVATNLASGEIMGSRGETRIGGINGNLQITHSGGTLDIDGAASLKLNARNSRGNVKHVSGAFMIDATGGDLTLSDVGGPLEIEARNTDLRIDGIKALKPPLRINGTSGAIRIDGLRTEARIDGRNSAIDVAMGGAAPVTIYNTGENINMTPPPGGYTIDAVATEGHLTLDDGALKPSGESADQRVTGAIRGGGPLLTLRVTRGYINLHARPAGK